MRPGQTSSSFTQIRSKRAEHSASPWRTLESTSQSCTLPPTARPARAAADQSVQSATRPLTRVSRRVTSTSATRSAPLHRQSHPTAKRMRRGRRRPARSRHQFALAAPNWRRSRAVASPLPPRLLRSQPGVAFAAPTAPLSQPGVASADPTATALAPCSCPRRPDCSALAPWRRLFRPDCFRSRTVFSPPTAQLLRSPISDSPYDSLAAPLLTQQHCQALSCSRGHCRGVGLLGHRRSPTPRDQHQASLQHRSPLHSPWAPSLPAALGGRALARGARRRAAGVTSAGTAGAVSAPCIYAAALCAGTAPLGARRDPDARRGAGRARPHGAGAPGRRTPSTLGSWSVGGSRESGRVAGPVLASTACATADRGRYSPYRPVCPRPSRGA